MQNLLDSSTYAKLSFRLYRWRFLVVYILIGAGSLWVEILLLRGLQYLGLSFIPAQLIGLVAGVFFAFWLNVRFNFKVPIAKRNRALSYFAAISIGSLTLNFIFKQQLHELGWSYEQARFGVAGTLFSFAYLLHRRFSFIDRKQVGVAVYANGVEDIRAIRQKIGDFPDFIHVDLIDASFGSADTDVRSYRLETIQAYWPRRKVHVHLMSKHPSRWLKDVLPYADVFIVHHEIDEDLGEILATISGAGKQAGLALMSTSPVEAAQPYLDQIKVLMLLTIAKPGHSGQEFQIESLDRIRTINSWPTRSGLALCVDGGVNELNIHLLNVELVVSGSSVLKAPNPAHQVMRLQTSSSFEAV